MVSPLSFSSGVDVSRLRSANGGIDLSDPPAGVNSLIWSLSTPQQRQDMLNEVTPQDEPGEDDVTVIAPDGGGGTSGGSSGGASGNGNTGGVGGPPRPGAGAGGTEPHPNPVSIAKITSAAGTADQNDLELVRTAIRVVPLQVLQALSDAGITVVASRGSVTDAFPHLRGQTPRGHPPGAVFDSLPGVYLPNKKVVVISVVGHGTPAGPHVPGYGEGHGSRNLALHEIMHAYDAVMTPYFKSDDVEFLKAYHSDFLSLPDYEKRDGGGVSEAYAESAARYFGGDHGGLETPALDAYWRATNLPIYK